MEAWDLLNDFQQNPGRYLYLYGTSPDMSGPEVYNRLVYSRYKHNYGVKKTRSKRRMYKKNKEAFIKFDCSWK